MLFMLCAGEFSSFQVVQHVEAPDDLDIDALYAEAYAAAPALSVGTAKGQDGVLNAFARLICERGGKLVDAVEIHVGSDFAWQPGAAFRSNNSEAFAKRG